MDLETTVRELTDRQAITALIYQYCECFDRNDPQGVAELFTPDAVIDYNPDTANILGADLAASIATGLRDTFAATSHHVSNILINLHTADTADSLSYIDAWHRYHAEVPDGYLWGRYRHEFKRTEKGWRISRLLLQAAGTVDFHRARMHGIGRR